MDYLVTFRNQMGKVRALLTYPDAAAFFLGLCLKTCKWPVITRLFDWFREFGIPAGGVIVNVLIDRSQVKPDSPQFVLTWVAMQDCYMTEIEEKFNGMVRSTMPLYETEVRGVPMLTRTAEQPFAEL